MPLLDVETVRIPELPEQEVLSDDDKIPVYISADNRTRQVDLQTLRTFLETGGGTFDPVYSGGTILYVVDASAHGNTSVSIPEIAGKNFKLSRDGLPLVPITEFVILDTGGFQLVDNELIEGQRYELDVFELTSGTIPGISASGGGGFISGSDTVNTNYLISTSDLNKVFQVRGGANALTITLPDVEQCPVNSFVIIECLVNNTKQHKIDTTNGQYIYHEDSSKTHLWLGKGDYIWAYRTDEGWTIINDKGNFSNLAMPYASYKVGLNQLLCDGSELLRASYPRLWEFVQTLGASLVSEATWQTASTTVSGRTVLKPYRGCFSTGDGSTTFRVPDLMNMALRGIKSVGGSDSERAQNFSGVYQRHEYESHNHNRSNDSGGNNYGLIPTAISGNKTPGDHDGIGNGTEPNVADSPKLMLNAGGAETRMDNIGVLWVINY